MATIHQRVHAYIWHWQNGPGWCRSDSPELRKLRAAGVRVIKAHLTDDGPIPRWLADLYRSLGFQLWGMAWMASPLWDDPQAAVEWLRGERDRLALSGFDLNGEEWLRAKDAATNGQYSATFAPACRRRHPTLPMHLDSYKGSMAASPGINLGAYKTAGFRNAIQSFWGGEGLYEDPIPNMVAWCKGANPTIPKGIVKPIIRVTRNNSGQLPDMDVVLNDCKASGVTGVQWYYIDGVHSVDWLCDLTKRAISMGVAA